MWFGGNDLKKLGNFFWVSFNVKMFFLINDPVIWRHRKSMLCCEKSNSWEKLGDNTQNINVQQSLKKLDKWGICLWIQNTKWWVAACGGKRPHHRGGVFLLPASEWITGAKSPVCSECYNHGAKTGQGSRCHMVCRVKGWGIMWDNCWIALASDNPKGWKEMRRTGKDQRILQRLGGLGAAVSASRQ